MTFSRPAAQAVLDSVMIIGAVADIHGNFDALTRAMERHPDVPLWLCVGDLASRTGAYPDAAAPLYWIKGNNEDFDRIAAWEAGEPQPRNLHCIRNGTAADVGSAARRRARRHVRADVVRHAAADLPLAAATPLREARRQAAPFRARGSRGVQAARASTS